MNDIIIESFVVKNEWAPNSGVKCGWGNGYAIIPRGHPCFEMGYDIINEQFDVSVNGGLTYSGYGKEGREIDEKYRNTDYWVVGFDTAHWSDTPERWPKERVEEEARSLAGQLYMIHVKHIRDGI